MSENGRALAPYALVFQARSGSTYLTELLDSHPSILAQKEVFANLKRRGKKRDWSKAETTQRQLEWMDEYYAAPPSLGVQSWGFKTKYADIRDKSGFAEILRKRDVRLIVLLRRNRVKVVVSFLNAVRLKRATGRWNMRGDLERLPPFSIDPEEFDGWLRQFEEALGYIRQFADTLGQPKLDVEYEDLISAPGPTLRSICSFLGVPYVKMQSPTRKNTSDDLRRVVLNFDELRSCYAGTKYEPMFDEVLVSPNL